jgi:hypothetical protein
MDDGTSLDALLPSPQGPQSLPPQMAQSTFQPMNSPIPAS